MERVRFGTYDFSPSTGELRRDGVAVRLQAQPARVLAALLNRPGEVVTRETLQREVWGEGTHVDFERGLNFCIAQVRSALRDSADAPRYIETVPKQGYRFIAPVAAEVSSVTGGAHDVPERSGGMPRRGAWLGAALVAVVVLAAGAAWNRAAAGVPAVVVVPFYNETGRPDLDPLARSIGDATVARLATEERRRMLSVIGNAPALANPFAREGVQRVARDLGARWVVIGQLKTDGRTMRVIGHLIRADDMKHTWADTFDHPAFDLSAQTQTAEAIAAAVAAGVGAPR